MAEKIEHPIVEIIEAQAHKFYEAFNDSDWARLVELYTEAPITLLANTPTLQGRDSIIAVLKGVKESGLVEMTGKVFYAEQFGDHAIVINNTKYSSKDKSQVHETRILAIWVQQGGEWKIAITSDSGAPSPEG